MSRYPARPEDRLATIIRDLQKRLLKAETRPIPTVLTGKTLSGTTVLDPLSLVYPWTPLVLDAAFVVEGSPYNDPMIAQDATGRWMLRGAAQTTGAPSVGATIATLPSGALPPAANEIFTAFATGGASRVDVDVFGQVLYGGSGLTASGQYISLSGISWFAT